MLPAGSEESSTSTVSLARIMYGTNEDFHASTMQARSGSSLAVRAAGSLMQDAASALHRFFHTAWHSLTHKP